jgi:hypothetical protein
MIREAAAFVQLTLVLLAIATSAEREIWPADKPLLIDARSAGSGQAQARAVPAPMCPVGPVLRPNDSRRIA